jgi:hypothetical protein
LKTLVLVGLLSVASPVAAGAEPWIDYDLLFQQHADKVVTATGADGRQTRRLDMGNGVVVECSDTGCVGTDQTGAVGCAWTIYSALLAMAEVCSIPPERTERLTGIHRKLTDFVAANAVPPRSTTEIEDLHRQEVEAYRTGKGKTGPIMCEEVTAPESEVMMMIDTMAEDESGYPDDVLAVPRLPVMNPCL